MKPGNHVFAKLFSLYLVVILISGLLISACKPKITETPVPTDTVVGYPTIDIPIITTPAQTVSNPTAAATLLPVAQGNSSAANAGLIILSMSDGAYNHLFAYHPSYLAMTRLTADAWDDDSPAISPDGGKIAFTSNRFGTREIYILDLVSNSLTQMTNSSAFEGTIDWSPDGSYIVYDVYQNEHFDLVIQSVNDQTEAPIQLTDGTTNNFQPSWSPDGSEIAFVSDRSGRNAIWLARLQNPEDRFMEVVSSKDVDYGSPVWSPDGTKLAITRHASNNEIVLIQPHNPIKELVVIGSGENPAWMPDGSGVLATIKLPNETEIVAYSVIDRHLMLPPIPMGGSIAEYDWNSGSLVQNIQTWVAKNTLPQPAPLWVETTVKPSSANNRRSLVELPEVTAPQALLSDAVDNSFIALRSLVNQRIGWDLLATLDNAVIPPTSSPMPGIPENWLYTGRAIGLNLAPYEAGWMVVNREEFAGNIYWRVWVKCKIQDGSCGEPLQDPVWDFQSRSSGNALAYENGGEYKPMPTGYWFDFSEMARRFGWQRLPAVNNWRSYFQGTQFNVFVFQNDLTWHKAMLEIYPSEQVDLLTGVSNED
jgi:TolB protein